MRRWAFLLVALAAGCHGEPSSPTALAVSQALPHAALSVAIEGGSIAASGDRSAPYLARFNIVIQETAGIAATVNFVNTTVRDAATGQVATPKGTFPMIPADIVARVGTSQLGPNGSLTVPQSVSYSVPSPGGAIALIVGVQATDTSGTVVSGAAQARIP